MDGSSPVLLCLPLSPRVCSKIMSIESVMPSNHLVLCCPLLLPPSIFPSIKVFFNALVLCIRWPKDLSFNFSISPSNEYPGLISFRMDWFYLLVVHVLTSGRWKLSKRHYTYYVWELGFFFYTVKISQRRRVFRLVDTFSDVTAFRQISLISEYHKCEYFSRTSRLLACNTGT